MIELAWWTVRQTAELLEVPADMVRRLLRAGEIPGERRDGDGAIPWRVDAAKLSRMLENGWQARATRWGQRRGRMEV